MTPDDKITFKVLRLACLLDGSRVGLRVQVIQEATPTSCYAIVVHDGKIGWVMPEQLKEWSFA